LPEHDALGASRKPRSANPDCRGRARAARGSDPGAALAKAETQREFALVLPEISQLAVQLPVGRWQPAATAGRGRRRRWDRGRVDQRAARPRQTLLSAWRCLFGLRMSRKPPRSSHRYQSLTTSGRANSQVRDPPLGDVLPIWKKIYDRAPKPCTAPAKTALGPPRASVSTTRCPRGLSLSDNPKVFATPTSAKLRCVR
jgi:hypothetical protein